METLFTSMYIRVDNTSLQLFKIRYLLPASVGWGKVIVSVSLSTGGRGKGYLPWPGPRYLPPGQVRGGGTPRYLPPAKLPTPKPGRGGGGVPQSTYPPARSGCGRGITRYLPPPSQGTYPLVRSGWGRGCPKVPNTPPPPQPIKDLLHGRRYASCVHRGGLSCSLCFCS